MRKLRNIGFVAVLVLATVALAQDSFKLRRTPKVGDTTVMTITADVDVFGIAAQFSAKVSEKVTKVYENGDYTVESTQSEGKIKLPDQVLDAPGETSTTRYAASGEVLEIQGTEVTAESYRLANLSTIIVPDKAFSKGEKGAFEIKATDKNGKIGGKGMFEVLGTEKVQGWDTVKLKVSFKESVESEPAGSEGIVWLNIADGSLVQAESQYTNAPFPGAPAPIAAKIKIVRQP